MESEMSRNMKEVVVCFKIKGTDNSHQLFFFLRLLSTVYNCQTLRSNIVPRFRSVLGLRFSKVAEVFRAALSYSKSYDGRSRAPFIQEGRRIRFSTFRYRWLKMALLSRNVSELKHRLHCGPFFINQSFDICQYLATKGVRAWFLGQAIP